MSRRSSFSSSTKLKKKIIEEEGYGELSDFFGQLKFVFSSSSEERKRSNAVIGTALEEEYTCS